MASDCHKKPNQQFSLWVWLGTGMFLRQAWLFQAKASGRLWGSFSRDDGSEQTVPGQEQMIGGDGPVVLEQARAGTQALSGLLPNSFKQVAGVVHGKGQQVEGDQHRSQGFFP